MSYVPPLGSSVVLNWTGNPYTPPVGSNVVLEFSGGYVLGATLADQLSFGTATVSQTDSQYVVTNGFFSEDFGAHLVSSPRTVTAVGIASTYALGTPFIAFRVRQLAPTGLNALSFGTSVVQNWIRYLEPTSIVTSTYGTAEVTHDERFLQPAGIAPPSIDPPRVENAVRSLNLLGWASSIVGVGAHVWDGKQYLTNVTLGDTSAISNPIVSEPVGPPDDTQYVEMSGQGIDVPDNQVWPNHKIENFIRELFPEGLTTHWVSSPTVEQTIYLSIGTLGAEWTEFGLPSVDQTVRLLAPESISAEYVSTNAQIYNARIDIVAGGFGSFVSGAHTVLRGASRPVVSSIDPTSVVSQFARVEYRIRHVDPDGYDAARYGFGLVQNRDLEARPGGIAPLVDAVPGPVVSFRVRYITDAGGVAPGTVPNSHYVAQFVQYIDLSACGIAPPSLGTDTSISERYRTVYPTFVASMIFGTPIVSRQLVVEPNGWESSQFSTQAEFLHNTRRVYAYTGSADSAIYGNATVRNQTLGIDLDRHGWYDTQWNFPVVYNLTQIVRVSPYKDNLLPETWGLYYPFVENVDRALRTFGHQSSRFGLSAWVRNTAEAVAPVGTETTLWGPLTFIAFRDREVAPEGLDSFYSSGYTVVWNAAKVIAPTGLNSTVAFGRPSLENLNRGITQHSGWVGAEWGTPFVAYAIRSVTQRPFNDAPFPIPEIRLNPYPITPIGIPKLGQIGGHELRIFRREVFPYALNVHDPWFGEATVRNRNVTTSPYGYDQSEIGRHTIENFIRYITPVSIEPELIVPPLIARRTRYIVPSAVNAPVFTVIHRIRNVTPSPPGPQTVALNRVKPDGSVDEGDGIAPPLWLSTHVVRRPVIYPEGIASGPRFGADTRVQSNALSPVFFVTDGAVGVPTVSGPRLVYPLGIEPDEHRYGLPRMTPFNIYAPSGSERPFGYTPNGQTPPIDALLQSPDGSSHPWFGKPAVSNRHRTIGPVPDHSNTTLSKLDGRTQYGDAVFTMRLQYVYPPSIRSLRMGFPAFPTSGDTINLDELGIASTYIVGDHRVARPVVPFSLQTVGVFGIAPLPWEQHVVELFNRQIYPEGNVQTRWGTALIGYPRRISVGMGVQSLWGNNVIEYLNRQVWPAGWVSCTLENVNFEDFLFPMRVTRRNPPLSIPSIASSNMFGAHVVTMRVRFILGRGINSYGAGYPVIGARTITVTGWESLEFGDIDRWEADKIKPHGDDMSSVGTPLLRHPVRPSGFVSSVVTYPRVGSGIMPIGIPNIAFAGPSVTNPFGCTNRVVTPLPILPSHVVPSPGVS